MTKSIFHIEYFRFEEDFIEDNLRCIPMIVRLKLDTIGIKLPLKAWSRFDESERTQLAIDPCGTAADILEYRNQLLNLANKYSIVNFSSIKIDEKSGWNNPYNIPDPLLNKFIQFRHHINISQWRSLTILQRFALIKLSRPSHESKNFEKAIVEFGLINEEQ